MGDALGLLPEGFEQEQVGAGLSGELIELLIETRANLRQLRQYSLADAIRDRLDALGVQLKDGAEGTSWTVS
jgi:cysteinyl-tRNA synthetase